MLLLADKREMYIRTSHAAGAIAGTTITSALTVRINNLDREQHHLFSSFPTNIGRYLSGSRSFRSQNKAERKQHFENDTILSLSVYDNLLRWRSHALVAFLSLGARAYPGLGRAGGGVVGNKARAGLDLHHVYTVDRCSLRRQAAPKERKKEKTASSRHVTGTPDGQKLSRDG